MYLSTNNPNRQRRIFNILPTPPHSRGATVISGQSYRSISLHSTRQHDHYPSRSQFLHSTTDLTPPSGLTGTVRTAFGPINTGVRTQDDHTAYASPIPHRTPRTSSAAIHRFSHTTVTVMQSSRYPYTADLLSLDECRPIVPSHPLPAECGHITTPLNIHQWRQLLALHPDKQLCRFQPECNTTTVSPGQHDLSAP